MKEGLQLIRVRQQRMKYLLLGLVPFVLLAEYFTEIVFILVAIAYGVLLLAYSLRLAFTECPRCEGFYHWNWWSNPWTRRCLHCGLRLDG